ncbi:uncharacterized protein LOC126741885 isoform X2 [Anthonomus grandis grandis]|uniref:uncharacterized protein LOC126741885 isoform X2 n=1 Tax=Anthonomus grandis grandis TaxID=2921223 RepID=UPI0021667E58|nr:uncharacterized protein LOC126741885 isoform X2 [Anthonomus grandis grandis]
MTTLTPNKCNGGHYSCSPPKECCNQGCCFLLAPSYSRPPSVQTGNMFANPLFLGHWYFWLAVTATIAGILCACSLWRKHSQGGLCCRTGSRQNRACSEPDSIGSCYAPPQYTSCNNFQAPPPPYSEVTSKPDMYPLVISYNHTEPAIKTNNTSSGYLMQYFRNFIRPVGSISATSTNDSISSSFLCNAVNDSNNLVPPTYSNVASLEELVLEPPPHTSPSSSERRLPRSASSVSSATTEYHQVLQHSPSATLPPKKSTSSGSSLAGVHLRTPLPISCQNFNGASAAVGVHQGGAVVAEGITKIVTPIKPYSPPPIKERPMLRPRRPPPQRSQDSTEDEELFSALLNLSICAPNSGEQAHPQSVTMLQELHFGVTNSMTGSDISSLANLGTPDSPPRATSPTVEMRELLDKIQQLPAQKSPHLPPNSSGAAQGRAYFHKMRAKTLYMPLGDVQNVNFGKSHGKALPSDEECKKRWRNIRDSYFRYKRKYKLPTGSSAEQKVPKWILFNRLLFLDKVSRERLSTTNKNEGETEMTDNVDEVEQTNSQLSSQNAENVGIIAAAATTRTSSADAVSLSTTGTRRLNRKKGKPDSSNDEIIKLLKKREEQRQETFRGMFQQSQASTDGPLPSFCEHIKSVLESLSPSLQVEAKRDIYNTISKYELLAVQSKVQHNNHYDYLESSSMHSSTSTPFPRESLLSVHKDMSNYNPFNSPPMQSPESFLPPQTSTNCPQGAEDKADDDIDFESVLLKL